MTKNAALNLLVIIAIGALGQLENTVQAQPSAALFDESEIGILRFGSNEGITATSIYGITYSNNGFLWAHTNIGVFVYNGFQFQSIPQLSGKEVIFANMFNDSLKMAMSFDNSITQINTRITETKELSLPDSMRLTAFAMTAYEDDGELMIGTSDGRILRNNQGAWSQIQFPPRQRLPTQNCSYTAN